MPSLAPNGRWTSILQSLPFPIVHRKCLLRVSSRSPSPSLLSPAPSRFGDLIGVRRHSFPADGSLSRSLRFDHTTSSVSISHSSSSISTSPSTYFAFCVTPAAATATATTSVAVATGSPFHCPIVATITLHLPTIFGTVYSFSPFDHDISPRF